jgi:hypothetical protein
MIIIEYAGQVNIGEEAVTAETAVDYEWLFEATCAD